MKKILLSITITLLLIFTLSFTFAKTSLKDIPLSNCQEIHQSGTYYLTTDITADPDESVCFDIYANNVIIDGKGHTIYGDEYIDSGIETSNNYTTIKNIEIKYFQECVASYFNANEITIKNSTFECYEDGLDLGPGNGFYVYNNTITRGESECIYLVSTNNAQVHDNVLKDCWDGIGLSDSNNTVINNNKISAEYWPIAINRGGIGVSIFNNYFKSLYRDGLWISDINRQPILNITKQLGTNIIGGRYMGGNYYARYNGRGYSETCFDGNRDGICDRPYSINGSIDYLPLTKLNPFIPIKTKSN